MQKKKDKKGRILLKGEYQRADGRYEYKYTDHTGKRQSVYSWKLNPGDSTPKGKISKFSLRELKKQIQQDLDDGICVGSTGNLTLNDYWNLYFPMKKNLKQSTSTNYKYMYVNYVQDTLGRMKLKYIKYSDIIKFYNTLIYDRGFKPNSVEIVHTILHQMLRSAVRDQMIRSNPADGTMAELKKSDSWVKPKRFALTEEQQTAFTGFVSNSVTYRHWLPLFTFLLGTGCRIGEALGLRWTDCNFENNVISINHSLIYRVQDNGKCEYHINTPKTQNGVREIPMLTEVKEALLAEEELQKMIGGNTQTVDGYTGFVFRNRHGKMLSPESVNRAIKRIYTEYNQTERSNAKAEQRDPVLLPHFSAHHLRHTFCTRLCEQESNLKLIEVIMGHADISTTMDIYNDITNAKKKEMFGRLDGKLKVL